MPHPKRTRFRPFLTNATSIFRTNGPRILEASSVSGPARDGPAGIPADPTQLMPPSVVLCTKISRYPAVRAQYHSQIITSACKKKTTSEATAGSPSGPKQNGLGGLNIRRKTHRALSSSNKFRTMSGLFSPTLSSSFWVWTQVSSNTKSIEAALKQVYQAD